ncbi:MAG TPA: hypothetical protein VGN97_03285 [Mesorhizobium sp.]|jgi:hypothetical protein|nr:hypothetical protein [Mesorhizobium sp.]
MPARSIVAASIAACALVSCASQALAIDITDLERSPSRFSYYALGHLVPTKGGTGPNSAPRHVVHPGIRLPMDINPAKGEHMYCNSQIFGYGGNGYGKLKAPSGKGSNDPRNYQFPWTTNTCEIRGAKDDPSVCPTKFIHQGQDCRPPKPLDQKYAGVAVENGTSYLQGGKSNTVALVGKSTIIWNYLHMRGLSAKGSKSAGQKLGMISDYYKGGTSIHLHIEAKVPTKKSFKHVDPLPSLIVAYQKALGNPYVVDEQGLLQFDPRFEIKQGASEVSEVAPGTSFCDAENQATLGTEQTHRFTSLWCHNGSIVGLVKDGARRQFVYYKPRKGMSLYVKGNPILFAGILDGMTYKGQAMHYSTRCGDQSFEVSGPVAVNFQHVTVSGRRKAFSKPDKPDGTPDCTPTFVQDQLEFSYIREFKDEQVPGTPEEEPGAEPAPVQVSEACKGVTLAEKPDSISGTKFDNYWFHNCSIIGLVKGSTGERRMYYVRPRSDIAAAVAREPAVFRGSSSAGRYEGETIQFNQTCGDLYYPVSGAIDADSRGVSLDGMKPRFKVENGVCRALEPQSVCHRFTYAGETLDEALALPVGGETCSPGSRTAPDLATDDGTMNLSNECKPKSVCSNNFPALTPKAEPKDYVAKGFKYLVEWPGYAINEEFRDKFGYVIPGFKSRVAGSGVWWYWMRARGNVAAKRAPTLRVLAKEYAGIDDGSHQTVLNYANAYRKHSIHYFGRQVGIDEKIDVSDPLNRWHLAQTMFHHEAGRRVPEVTEEIFQRGLRLAEEKLKQ